MADPKPPLVAELLWSKDLQFAATSGSAALIIDGDSKTGASPTQLLAMALAGCMAADVVSILQKGRHPLSGCRATLTAERAPDPPRRFTLVTLHFHLAGAPPADAVERAIALSREKYCSVYHSLRTDIDFRTSYEIRP